MSRQWKGPASPKICGAFLTMVWDLPCRLQDLNLQPPYYKYGALPIAPSRRDRQSIDARGVVRSGQPAGVAVGVGVGVAVE